MSPRSSSLPRLQHVRCKGHIESHVGHPASPPLPSCPVLLSLLFLSRSKIQPGVPPCMSLSHLSSLSGTLPSLFPRHWHWGAARPAVLWKPPTSLGEQLRPQGSREWADPAPQAPPSSPNTGSTSGTLSWAAWASRLQAGSALWPRRGGCGPAGE